MAERPEVAAAVAALEAEREREVAVLLGGPGTGKTTLLQTWIDRYPASSGSVRALDPPPGTWPWGEWPGYSGIREWLSRVKGVDADGLPIAGAEPHRGLLVADDCDRYIGNVSYIRDGWRDLWVANRHFHMDVAAVARRPQELPKVMLAAASEIWCFAQEESYAEEYLLGLRIFRVHGITSLPQESGVAYRLRPRDGVCQLVQVFTPRRRGGSTVAAGQPKRAPAAPEEEDG